MGKIITRNKQSAPPTNDQLEYLLQTKAQLMEVKSTETHRVVIEISPSIYALDEPREPYKKTEK